MLFLCCPWPVPKIPLTLYICNYDNIHNTADRGAKSAVSFYFKQIVTHSVHILETSYFTSSARYFGTKGNVHLWNNIYISDVTRCCIKLFLSFVKPPQRLLYQKKKQHRYTNNLLSILYICILSHIAISLSLFLSVFCAACQCFKTLFSVLNTFWLGWGEDGQFRPKHVVVLKILKWQVLRTLKSVLDIDKTERKSEGESEISQFVSFN
jgi:hypothetical protein